MSLTRNLSIRSRLLGYGLVALGLAAILGVAGYVELQRVADSGAAIARSGLALRNHMSADMMHDAIRGDVLSSLVASTDAEREEVRTAIAEHAETLRASVADNRELDLPSGVEAALSEVGPALEAYVTSGESTIELALGDPAAGRAAFPEFMVAFSDLEERMESAAEKIESFVNETDAAATALAGTAQRTMLAVWVVSSVLLLLAARWIARSIVTPIQAMNARLQEIANGDGDLTKRLTADSGDETGELARSLNQFIDNLEKLLVDVRHAAEELHAEVRGVAESSQGIASGAQSQAAALQQTAASLEELTDGVNHNAENVDEVDRIVGSARTSADSGRQVVTRAVDAMKTLGSSSARIGAIVSIIDDIAFQTNLLALNAAVEAARAGEQGRGFAVVATEVRNLAQRSADSAREIKTLIDESTRNVESSSGLVNSSGDALREIFESVQRISAMTSQISGSSREQSTGIQQINKAVSQMDGVVQQSSASTEELSAAAMTMSQEADQLLKLVSRFKLSSSGTSRSASSALGAPKAPLRSTPRDASPAMSASASGANSSWE